MRFSDWSSDVCSSDLTMPGATSAAQGRKSERREARRACSQRNIMGSAFEESGKRHVAARDGEYLRIAPRGEDGEAVADHRHDETSDPEPEPDPDRGGQRSIDDGERTRRAGEQDRFGERAMHRHREAGQVLLHPTSAPPPKLKKERKKELAAKATDRQKTTWIRRRKPPQGIGSATGRARGAPNGS